MFKRFAFLFGLLTFSLNIFAADGNADLSGMTKIQILNSTSDLGIVFNSDDNQLKFNQSFGDYSNGQYEFDYGEGLIRSIFGDFKNVIDRNSGNAYTGKTFKKTFDEEKDLVAGVFYGQSYVIKMLQMAMLKFTTLILWVYGVFFLLGSTWGLMKVGGDEKTVLGHIGRNNIPYKMLLGLLFIFPTTSGYTVGQLLHTQLNLLSNYGGRYIYLSSLNLVSEEYIKDSTRSLMRAKLQNLIDPNSAIKDLVRAEFCNAFMNQRVEKSLTKKGSVIFDRTVILSPTQIIINYGPTKESSVLDLIHLKGGDYPKEVYEYQALAAANGVPVDYCGSIKIPFQVVDNVSDEKLKKQYQINNSIAIMHLNGMLTASKIAKDFWDNNESEIANLGEGVYASLAQIINKMSKSYITTMELMLKDRSVDTFENWWEKLPFTGNNNSTGYNKILSGQFADLDKNSIQSQFLSTLLNFSINGMEGKKNQVRNDMESAVKTLTDNLFNGKESNPYKNLILYGRAYGWIDAGAWFTTLSNISVPDRIIFPNAPVTTRANLAFDKVSDDKTQNQFRTADQAFYLDISKYNNLNMYLDPATFKSVSVANLSTVINELYLSTDGGVVTEYEKNPYSKETVPFAVTLARYIGYDPANYKTHPLMQLKLTGESMQMLGTGLLGGALFTSFSYEKEKKANDDNVSGGIDNAKQNTVVEAFKGLLGRAGTMFFFLAIALLVGGFILGTYLPMLPTIYWVLGVMAWASGMVMNFLAIPIVGLVIAYSSTEDFAGRTINFFMALIENALRPIIMPIALLVSIIFQALFVSLSSRLISQAYMIGDLGTYSLSVLFFIIVYVYFNYIVLVSNAALIKIIPEELSKRINGVSAVQDESEQMAQKLSGMLSQSRGEASGAFGAVLRSR